jgi:hypothetical membrane protein
MVEASDTAPMTETAPARVRAFALPVISILLLQMAWWAVLPMFRGPDEIGHIYRASAVAQGQWGPSGGEVPTKVDGRLVAAAAPVCHELYDDFLPAVCEPRATYPDGTVGISSTADKYNPTYYAVAGIGSRMLHGAPAAWSMRAVSGLVCAGLIGWAWGLARRHSRSTALSAALVVVSSPAVVFAGAVVAPNGTQFAAALLLWCALLAASRGSSGAAAPIAAGVSGAVLMSTHTTGPLWVSLTVLVMLVALGAKGTLAVLRREPRWWAAATALVLASTTASVLWTLTASTNAPQSGGELLTTETRDIGLVPNVILWVLQTVGVMPNRFGLVWPISYLMWLVPLAAFLIWGLRRSQKRLVLGSLTALALSIVVPAVLTAATYADLGYAWQGRYGLPLLVGVILVAAEGADRVGATLRPSVLAGGVALLGLAHLLSMLCVGLREASGPYDDGRPWAILLWVIVPLLVTAGYGGFWALIRPVGRTS